MSMTTPKARTAIRPIRWELFCVALLPWWWWNVGIAPVMRNWVSWSVFGYPWGREQTNVVRVVRRDYAAEEKTWQWICDINQH